ncbi:MAG: acyltransferase [Anaerolineales bacterium]|jgi:peptidoglycan/LPS O-acetylase OafA/YrhL|nr:acyltransferase [Anaerolineales bacterium]
MIPGLDGLRAAAFLILFGLHTDYLQFGWMGVQMFFVLSGFLITNILLGMKENLPLGSYLYKFYVRRFLRIFPLYYFFLFLMLGLAAWLISISYRTSLMKVIQDQAVYAFLYVYDFISAYRGFEPSRFLDHLWSLSVEEQFYLVWPLLIFLTPQKSLKKLFLAGIIAGPLFRVAFYFAYHLGLSAYLREPVALALYPLPFTHVDAFAFGAYISRFSIPNARRQLVFLGGFLPLAGFASQYLATGEAGALSSLGYPVTLPNAYQFLWAYSLINYWFAILIYCIVNEGLFVKFLDLPLLQYLGKISYGLYVYHFPVIWFAGRLRDVQGLEGISYPQITLVALAGTILIASISYHLLERPLIRLKDTLAAYTRTDTNPRTP